VLTARQNHRVEWGHCDPTGAIQTTQFHFWIEQASHRLCEVAGFGHADIEKDPQLKGFPAVSVEAELISLPKYGDIITVTSRVVRLGNSSLQIEHVFELDSHLLAKGYEIKVCATGSEQNQHELQAIPIPEHIRKNFADQRLIEFS